MHYIHVYPQNYVQIVLLNKSTYEVTADDFAM